MQADVLHTQHMVDEPQSFYELWQQQRFGNVLPGTTAMNDLDESVDALLSKLTAHYEKQLDDHWNY